MENKNYNSKSAFGIRPDTVIEFEISTAINTTMVANQVPRFVMHKLTKSTPVKNSKQPKLLKLKSVTRAL